MSGWLPRPTTWDKRGPLSSWWLAASLPALQAAVVILPELNNSTAGMMAGALALNSVYRCLFSTAGVPGVGMGTGLMAFHIWMSTMDLLVFRRHEIVGLPSKAGKDTARDDLHNNQQGALPPPISLARFKWAFHTLGTSMYRGAFRLDGHDKPISDSQRQSRTRIVIELVRRILVAFLFLDATVSYFVSQVGGPSVFSLSLVETAVASIGTGVIFFGIIAVRLTSVAVVLLLLGVYNPVRTPTLFGPWGQNTTIKSFWGKGWHQLFRTCFKSPSHCFMRRLGIDEYSALGEMIKIPVAFFLSACMHACGQYCATGTGLGTFTFFMLQPVGIGIEKLAARHTPQHLKDKYARPVGLLWTYGFLILMNPLFFGEARDAGLYVNEVSGISVVRGVLRGEWRPEARKGAKL